MDCLDSRRALFKNHMYPKVQETMEMLEREGGRECQGREARRIGRERREE